MEAIFFEWGAALLRWVHIITGIAWIGASFYFMHLDASLRPSPNFDPAQGGEAWEVHGGGFYQVRKYKVAPDMLPAHLTWHKWQAYSTWISGFFLLMWIYYGQSQLFLIDPAILAISPLTAAAIGIVSLGFGWIIYNTLVSSALARQPTMLAAVGFVFIMAMAFFYQHVFSGRGALLHTGALMGTMMVGNVFLNIIPNQKIVVADLIAGRAPDPRFGQQAKTRSTHNNYLTLPVLFLMISNHYPLAFTSPYAWVMVGLVLIAGATVRHFYNERHAGRGDKWWTWAVAAVAMLAVIALSALSVPAARATLGLAEIPQHEHVAVASVPDEVSSVILSRCSMCHSSNPAYPGIVVAPKGVHLENADDIVREATAIRLEAVLTRAMPPNNISGMTDDDRRTLAAWLQHVGR